MTTSYRRAKRTEWEDGSEAFAYEVVITVLQHFYPMCHILKAAFDLGNELDGYSNIVADLTLTAPIPESNSNQIELIIRVTRSKSFESFNIAKVEVNDGIKNPYDTTFAIERGTGALRIQTL